jgi:hypothetical protein
MPTKLDREDDDHGSTPRARAVKSAVERPAVLYSATA